MLILNKQSVLICFSHCSGFKMVSISVKRGTGTKISLKRKQFLRVKSYHHQRSTLFSKQHIYLHLHLPIYIYVHFWSHSASKCLHLYIIHQKVDSPRVETPKNQHPQPPSIEEQVTFPTEFLFLIFDYLYNILEM